MTPPHEPEAGKAAYLKAQKQRNLAIGGALLVFVILVFFITMARISSNSKQEIERRQAAASASLASASH